MKFILTFITLVAILMTQAQAIPIAGEDQLHVAVPSAVLMEKSSGEMIYLKNEHDRLSPASVTKIMTLLLVMEEIDAGRLTFDDSVTCTARASSMGGSQIWLEEGETMSVSDMIKAVSVVSANDCAVALAEHIAGSEESFVLRMNERAKELGMNDTVFCDCTGLTEDPEHLTSAYDIALMSRELIKHEKIKEYTTIWMDTLRDGKSALTNTNRLVRFYNGATGLKTGFTQKAMYCLSATAMRDGTEYIAVVMHAATTDERFESAKALLNYAFANYAVCPLRSPQALPPVRVELGEVESVQPIYAGEEGMLTKKTAVKEISYEIELPESVPSPVFQGDVLGELVVKSGDQELARVPLVASVTVERMTVPKVFEKLISRFFGGF